MELYYIFATVWGREAYTLYGILLIIFLILMSVTACISIALTYFQLSSEDYRWWWRSVFSSGWASIRTDGLHKLIILCSNPHCDCRDERQYNCVITSKFLSLCLPLRSTGFFVFGYALFYYYERSHMYGTLQTLEFFGYTCLFCYVFFLVLGTVSFFASLYFVRYIYRNLKMD